MVLAITEIGVQSGRMHSDIAAALVGAALLSVLLFPAIAGGLYSKRYCGEIAQIMTLGLRP